LNFTACNEIHNTVDFVYRSLLLETVAYSETKTDGFATKSLLG